jgi:glycosyltransferase involved in cell wall biosynthesis
MSVGLPIVANDIGGWTEIIKKEHVGLVTSDNPKEFGEVLIDLLSDLKVMQSCAISGLQLIAKRYNWDNSAQVLLQVYENLMSKS